MTERDRTGAENKVLRARLSALSAASLRINASLELETVLKEVVESARALTGARFGAIATIDETGTSRDFVTSGFTEEERRRLHRQALLADRAHGADPGGRAPPGGSRLVRARGTGHQLRPAPGQHGWPPGGADGDRV